MTKTVENVQNDLELKKSRIKNLNSKNQTNDADIESVTTEAPPDTTTEEEPASTTVEAEARNDVKAEEEVEIGDRLILRLEEELVLGPGEDWRPVKHHNYHANITLAVRLGCSKDFTGQACSVAKQ